MAACKNADLNETILVGKR